MEYCPKCGWKGLIEMIADADISARWRKRIRAFIELHKRVTLTQLINGVRGMRATEMHRILEDMNTVKQIKLSRQPPLTGFKPTVIIEWMGSPTTVK